jgi:hypothetical protein
MFQYLDSKLFDKALRGNLTLEEAIEFALSKLSENWQSISPDSRSRIRQLILNFIAETKDAVS